MQACPIQFISHWRRVSIAKDVRNMCCHGLRSGLKGTIPKVLWWKCSWEDNTGPAAIWLEIQKHLLPYRQTMEQILSSSPPPWRVLFVWHLWIKFSQEQRNTYVYFWRLCFHDFHMTQLCCFLCHCDRGPSELYPVFELYFPFAF